MPSNKSSRDGAEEVTPSPLPPPPPQDDLNLEDCVNHGQGGDASDSDGSSSSSDKEKQEFIVVSLPEIRKEVQCPICLGIIRKTRTVMGCLHRFCRECIDKSMRLGNNECPSCRMHCASRRSLRDDPNFDALISVLYPNVDKYEEEELALHEEEKARNRLIQDSIAETLRRQNEALGKKRPRKQGSSSSSRYRRSRRAVEQHDSDEDEGVNGNECSKDSSSADEPSIEVRQKRSRRTRGASQLLSEGKSSKAKNDSRSGLVRGKEILRWGRGRIRSNNRHAGFGWSGGRLTKAERLLNLTQHLRGSNQNEEMKISLTAVSLSEDKTPNLQRPYICCSPKMSVQQLSQYVAMQLSMDAIEIEIMIVKDSYPCDNSPFSVKEPFNPCNREFQLLEDHLTLEDVHATFAQQNLVLAYRQKSQDKGKEE